MPNCRKYNVDNDDFRRKKLYTQVRFCLLHTRTTTIATTIASTSDISQSKQSCFQGRRHIFFQPKEEVLGSVMGCGVYASRECTRAGCHRDTNAHSKACPPFRLRKLYRKYANDQLGGITHGLIEYTNFCQRMQVRLGVLRMWCCIDMPGWFGHSLLLIGDLSAQFLLDPLLTDLELKRSFMNSTMCACERGHLGRSNDGLGESTIEPMPCH